MPPAFPPTRPWLDAGQPNGIEVEGTARDAELWALPFAPLPLPVGIEIKIVWRMTGSGPLRVAAAHGDGSPARLTIMHEHDGSNWNRPGEEWGTGFVFPKAGSWHLRLVRTTGSGDVWLMVR